MEIGGASPAGGRRCRGSAQAHSGTYDGESANKTPEGPFSQHDSGGRGPGIGPQMRTDKSAAICTDADAERDYYIRTHGAPPCARDRQSGHRAAFDANHHHHRIVGLYIPDPSAPSWGPEGLEGGVLGLGELGRDGPGKTSQTTTPTERCSKTWCSLLCITVHIPWWPSWNRRKLTSVPPCNAVRLN